MEIPVNSELALYALCAPAKPDAGTITPLLYRCTDDADIEH